MHQSRAEADASGAAGPRLTGRGASFEQWASVNARTVAHVETRKTSLLALEATVTEHFSFLFSVPEDCNSSCVYCHRKTKHRSQNQFGSAGLFLWKKTEKKWVVFLFFAFVFVHSSERRNVFFRMFTATCRDSFFFFFCSSMCRYVSRSETRGNNSSRSSISPEMLGCLLTSLFCHFKTNVILEADG